MAVSDLPALVTRRGTAPPVDGGGPQEAPTLELAHAGAPQRARVDGEVRFDAGSRAAYSTDASNFRQTVPKD